MFVSFLEYLSENPMMMTMIGAFGIFHLLIFSSVFVAIAELFIAKDSQKKLRIKIGIWVAISWILGFLTQIVFLFMGISVLHCFFIYITMLILVFIAVFSLNKFDELYEEYKDKLDVIKNFTGKYSGDN